MARRNVKVRDIKDVSGEVNVAGRDIVKNIKTIHQRALTAAEEASRGRKLESKVLAQGVSQLVQNLSVQASQSTESDSPYKGLLAYNLNEAEIFFGRDKAKRDLLKCIKQDALTVLHAESGAGKSSLLQAGVAAQLIANGDLVIRLRSHRANPIDFIKQTFLPELSQAPALAKASLREFLRQVDGVLGSKVSLYLLLDQFEEFFNLLTKEERQPFLESLADCLNDSSLNVRWVLALRAEALSDLAELEAVGIAPFKNLYRLNRLSRDEAQEAIIEPAKRYSILFEPALMDHILDSLTTNGAVTPTQLQLICSALTNDLPTDKRLTLNYYIEQEGGTEGILRDYLRRQLEHLPAQEQASAWKVLRTLITADRMRAVKTYDEIEQELKLSGISRQQIHTLLARLVERRLLSTQPAATETFELAHDYLVKEIELDPEEQARKAAQELLAQEVRAYQRHKTLLTEDRLKLIERYMDELSLTSEAEQLLVESRERLIHEEQRWQELYEEADHQRKEAERQSTVSLARQLAAQAQSILATGYSKQTTAVLLAVKSMQLFSLGEAAQILSTTLSQPISCMTHDNGVTSVAFSPDGKFVVSGSEDKTIRVWEAMTGKEISCMTHDADVHSVAFSPDGKYVVSRSGDKTVRVWEAMMGKEIALITHYDGRYSAVSSVAFSPDGKYVVSGSGDYRYIQSMVEPGESTACVWEAMTGKQISFKTHDYPVNTVVFSPDGKYVVSGDVVGTVLVWEAMTGIKISRMEHDRGINVDGDVRSVAFSPDGRFVVSSGIGDKTARVWEAMTGKEIARVAHASDFLAS